MPSSRPAALFPAVLRCNLPCRAMPCCVVPCHPLPWRGGLRLAVSHGAESCCAVPCRGVPCHFALHGGVLCCGVLCCDVLCRALLCPAVWWVKRTAGPAWGGVGAG